MSGGSANSSVGSTSSIGSTLSLNGGTTTIIGKVLNMDAATPPINTVVAANNGGGVGGGGASSSVVCNNPTNGIEILNGSLTDNNNHPMHLMSTNSQTQISNRRRTISSNSNG